MTLSETVVSLIESDIFALSCGHRSSAWHARYSGPSNRIHKIFDAVYL